MMYAIFIIGLAVGNVCGELVNISIQAENMSGNVLEINRRNRASGQQSVHLYKGDSIHTELCFMPNTELTIKAVVYSNDGLEDHVRVSLDKTVLGEFESMVFTDSGRGWNRFRSSRNMFTVVTEGRRIITLKIVDSDTYGIEIDLVELSLYNTQTLDSLKCDVFCFDDVSFPCSSPKYSPPGTARALQRSVKTKCAEEDNINVPVFSDRAKRLNYVVTASFPKYRSFQNNRNPDWTDCKMAAEYWKYADVKFGDDQPRRTSTSVLNISNSTSGMVGNWYPSVIEVEFELDGPSTGEIYSEVGARVHLRHVRTQGTLTFRFQYYDRYNQWSSRQRQMVKRIERNVVFEIPDFSFREGRGNKIRIEVYSDQNSTFIISIGELYMLKRLLKPDQSITLYKDEQTVIEGVDIDMWWRINETMSVTIADQGQTFNGIDYIQIYQRVPWTKDGFSQVFVLYQDANVRLLPTTPHGLDWIPFGSSVIIGQTNPLSNRPCAPISHLTIDPNSLKIKLFYMDGGIVPLHIQTTLAETQLHVAGSHYTRDMNRYPFFTFRSMYVTDGNNDVDHISVDGGPSIAIVDQWNTIHGNYFAFYRKCISKHNTLSPDITLQISA